MLCAHVCASTQFYRYLHYWSSVDFPFHSKSPRTSITRTWILVLILLTLACCGQTNQVQSSIHDNEIENEQIQSTRINLRCVRFSDTDSQMQMYVDIWMRWAGWVITCNWEIPTLMISNVLPWREILEYWDNILPCKLLWRLYQKLHHWLVKNVAVILNINYYI